MTNLKHPILQTNISMERGDRMKASVATLFELEGEQVPNFRLFPDETWWNVFVGFIWGLGYVVKEVVEDKRPLVGTIGNALLADVESNYPGYSHSVVINTDGYVIHDPHPCKIFSGKNILNIMKCWYLIEKDNP